MPIYNFYARIWEKAEHWYFDIELTAPNRHTAWADVTKSFPKKDYRIAELSQHGPAINNVATT
jgi:hypothetical protein